MMFILLEAAAVAFEARQRSDERQDLSVVVILLYPGDHGGGVTPVPIPNTAVKPSSADGTARVAWWESRTLPGFFLHP